MNCEMDGAFAEVRGVTMTRAHNCQPDHCLSDPQAYGGDSTPFGPITMLFAMWKANTELAGYAQQGIQGYSGPSVWCCQTEMSAS
jgi:hypothetical protein